LDLRPDVLRGEAMQAAIVQACHIDRALRPTGALLWSLASGDIVRNLRALSEGPRPSDSLASKSHDLLRVGVDVEAVAEGIALLQDGRSMVDTAC